MFVEREQIMPKRVRLVYGDASSYFEVYPTTTFKDCFLEFLRVLEDVAI